MWTLSFDSEIDWDIIWLDSSIDPDFLSKMKSYQKVNHFPGMYAITKKNHLGRNLMRMRKKFPQHYDFFPETWLLPLEYLSLRNEIYRKNNSQTFIIKPEALSQGKGIFLTKNFGEIPFGEHYVAQKYIANPFLIDNLKFDLRLYVLITGCNPLRIFLHNDGLARFSTNAYSAPSKENLKDTFMHITNYAINKDNPNFIFNLSSDKDDIGHKRSLKSIFKVKSPHIKKKNYIN